MRDESGKPEEVEHSSRRWEFLLSSCSLICCAILSCVKPLQFRDTRIIASREWAVNGISNTQHLCIFSFHALFLLTWTQISNGGTKMNVCGYIYFRTFYALKFCVEFGCSLLDSRNNYACQG